MAAAASGHPALVIDIGGTKLAAGVAEPAGRMITWASIPTPDSLDAEQLWRTLEALLRKVLGEAGRDEAGLDESGDGLAGVGCGCGGPMEWPAGRVSPLNIAAWRDFPLRDRLAGRFPEIPVRVHNDAICLAVGEHWRGAGRGTGNMLGVVVSTGGRGCLEAIARGPALAAWAREQGWRPGQAGATAADLAADAAGGHPVALAAMRRAGRALGIALASATHLCDLEVVSVGGGLSQAGALLFDPAEEFLRAHAKFRFARKVRVVPAALGQSAGLVGAAALIFAADRYWTGG